MNESFPRMASSIMLPCWKRNPAERRNLYEPDFRKNAEGRAVYLPVLYPRSYL